MTKRHIGAASADAGLMALAYNLRRLVNLGVALRLRLISRSFAAFFERILGRLSQIGPTNGVKTIFSQYPMQDATPIIEINTRHWNFRQF